MFFILLRQLLAKEDMGRRNKRKHNQSNNAGQNKGVQDKPLKPFETIVMPEPCDIPPAPESECADEPK